MLIEIVGSSISCVNFRRSSKNRMASSGEILRDLFFFIYHGIFEF
jgi:hypothetical protein